MGKIELNNEQLELLLNGEEVILSEYNINGSVALKKKVEKWEPKGGRHYVSAEGRIMLSTQKSDEARCFGMHRETVDECVKARNAMNTFNRLLAYVDEFDPGFELGCNEYVWYIYYNENDDIYEHASDRVSIDVGKVYMSEEVAEELCRKLNNGEVEL